MSRILVAARLAILPFVLGLFAANEMIRLVDRFAYEGESLLFYSQKTDMTCITVMVHGKTTIWCADGDRTGEVEKP